MCFLKLFAKKNETRPAGPRIADAAFPESPAGRTPSENETRLYALYAKEPTALTGEERRVKAETEAAFLAARQAASDCPVDIGKAPALPLALAKFLLVRGFSVRSVPAGSISEAERETYGYLTVHFPDLLLTEKAGEEALYLDGREAVPFSPEGDTLKDLAERMAEKARKMRFVI